MQNELERVRFIWQWVQEPTSKKTGSKKSLAHYTLQLTHLSALYRHGPTSRNGQCVSILTTFEHMKMFVILLYSKKPWAFLSLANNVVKRVPNTTALFRCVFDEYSPSSQSSTYTLILITWNLPVYYVIRGWVLQGLGEFTLA